MNSYDMCYTPRLGTHLELEWLEFALRVWELPSSCALCVFMSSLGLLLGISDDCSRVGVSLCSILFWKHAVLLRSY